MQRKYTLNINLALIIKQLRLDVQVLVCFSVPAFQPNPPPEAATGLRLADILHTNFQPLLICAACVSIPLILSRKTII
jgi:hypothetical protein